jgi:predicted nucleotide-binding protein
VQKTEILKNLKSFRSRLYAEVTDAYYDKGEEYGAERFASWQRQFIKFLDANLPGKSSLLNSKLSLNTGIIKIGGGSFDRFMREHRVPATAFIDSLILDIENDEFAIEHSNNNTERRGEQTMPNRVFIVHGHDELTKTEVARFIEKLGYEAIILHEQASMGKTIIEKIETYTDVGFAIVLYTADDKGNSNDKADRGQLNNRARQNVVFEHGYLVAKLSRTKVVTLVSGDLELPSDISGIVYINNTNWKIDIAKEMKSVGYAVDTNKIV